MLYKCQVVIASEFARPYALNTYRCIMDSNDLTRLLGKSTVTPESHLGIAVTPLELIEYRDGWRNVAARPPAYRENFHMASPLFVHVQYSAKSEKPHPTLQQ